MWDSEQDLRAAVHSDDPTVRWNAAYSEHLPVELMGVLAADPDDAVVKSLLGNYSVPREVIAELREARPDLIEQVSMHPNAPVDLAEGLPMWKHTQLSIRSYCQVRGLGPDVRDRLLEVWGDAAPPDSTTLGEAVAEAG
jgi:hypothetical protein